MGISILGPDLSEKVAGEKGGDLGREVAQIAGRQKASLSPGWHGRLHPIDRLPALAISLLLSWSRQASSFILLHDRPGPGPWHWLESGLAWA